MLEQEYLASLNGSLIGSVAKVRLTGTSSFFMLTSQIIRNIFAYGDAALYTLFYKKQTFHLQPGFFLIVCRVQPQIHPNGFLNS